MNALKRSFVFLFVSVMVLSTTVQGVGTEEFPEATPAAQTAPAEMLLPAVSASPAVPVQSIAPVLETTAAPAPSEEAPAPEEEVPAPAQPEAAPPAPTEEVYYKLFYYTVDGALLHTDKVAAGRKVARPFRAPEVEGFAFQYWFAVDRHFKGRQDVAYRFDKPMEADLYVCALYLPVEAEEADAPARGPETPSGVDGEEAPAPAELTAPVEAAEAIEATNEPEVTEAPETTDAPEATEATEATDAPEATEAPEVTDAPETTSEPEATEAPAGEETAQPDKGITISMSCLSAKPAAGDTIYLHAALEGYEGMDVQIDWQYALSEEDARNGIFVSDRIGGLTHSFVLSTETYYYLWRAVVIEQP